MSTKIEEVSFSYDEIHAYLGKKFQEAYLQNRGYTLADLKSLPTVDAKQLRKEASIYASNKLAEIELKALFINKIHDAYSR